jgi:hypothetical protein
MSQQLQAPHEAQTPVVQGTQGQAIGGAIRGRFDDSVPQDVRSAVLDLDRVETLCEWLDYQATERNRPRLAQRAEDVSEIAHLQKQLLLRESPFAEPVGQAAQGVIQQAVQEFQARSTDPEVQDAAAQLGQTLESLGQILAGPQGMTGQPSAPTPASAASPAPEMTQGPATGQPPAEQQFGAQQPAQQPAGQQIGAQPPAQQQQIGTQQPAQQPTTGQPTSEVPPQQDPYTGGR